MEAKINVWEPEYAQSVCGWTSKCGYANKKKADIFYSVNLKYKQTF